MRFNGKKLIHSIAFNRRNFIKLLIGGAVGTTLSPLPWKLTDDIAIWTQNWPWVPMPERGAVHYVDSVCTLCPGGCGISVRKVDQRAVRIEERKDYPINPAGLCPVGLGGLQLLYDESIRFTGPMKRAGIRGDIIDTAVKIAYGYGLQHMAAGKIQQYHIPVLSGTCMAAYPQPVAVVA